MKPGKKLIACFISLFAAIILVVCCLWVEGERAHAMDLSSITSDSIAAKKEEIANAAAQQGSIKNSISNMEKIVKDLEHKKADLDKYIESIDATMNSIQDKIKSYEKLIAEKEAELNLKEKELTEALEQEEEQYEIMQQHIQYLYERGEVSYLEATLTADSFASMLNRAE